jgi:hypothetical protein
MVWNILTYSRITHGVGYEGVLQTTGPIMYTKALWNRLHRKGIHLVSYTDLGLFSSIYERLENNLTDKHTHMYKQHYSNVREPVVGLNIFKRIKTI